jgi:hypothetical protein
MSGEVNLKIDICCRRSSVPPDDLVADLYKMLLDQGHLEKNIQVEYLQNSTPSEVSGGAVDTGTGCDGITCDEKILIRFVPEI